jgi:MFS family permease
MEDLSITSGAAGALQVSIYLFPFGIGPLFLAPLSETYGRAPIMLIGNAVFIAFCVGGGFATTVSIPNRVYSPLRLTYTLRRLLGYLSAESSQALEVQQPSQYMEASC